jgi:enoyl-CoA hydratase/carnithine racemase
MPWAAPLPWLIPPRIAMQMLVTGDPITAERAHQVGLVNEVVPADQLAAAAQALGERIAANAPLSVLAGKQTVRLVAEYPLSEAFERAEEIWRPVYLSADAQEGPAAFRDRRSPKWLGR